MIPKIEKSILIEDLVEAHPELIGPLKRFGIACIRCGEPVWGTLEETALDKGIPNIDEIVEEMNRILAREDG